MTSGSVGRGTVIKVLKEILAVSSATIEVQNPEVIIVKDETPAVYNLPENVPRKMLHRLAEKYGIPIEYFYHPEMLSSRNK